MIYLIGILVCLLVSIGLVQCIGWLVCMRKRPRGVRKGYHIIPLYDGPDQTEAQLRYALSQLQWGCESKELVLLLDMGMEEESRRICEEMMQKNTLFSCTEQDLAQTIRQLDELQNT